MDNQLIKGYVSIVLSDHAQAALLKDAERPVRLAKELVLAFAPPQSVFDTKFKSLIGQEVAFPVFSRVSDERGQIVIARLPQEIPSLQAAFIVVSLADGVSIDSVEDLVKRGLSVPIEDDDMPMYYLGGIVTLVPFMGGWASEIAGRQAASADDANDDSFFVDRAPSAERRLEGAPELGMPKAAPRIVVASYGPTSSAPDYQIIGARRRYRVTTGEIPFDLAGWSCTDAGGKPALKGSWMIKVAKAKGEGFTAPAEIPVASFAEPATVPTSRAERKKGGGVNVIQQTRQIVIPTKVGQRFQGRYRKRDGSMSFQDVELKFRAGTPSKTERWDGPTNGYSEFYESVTAGGVKMNLIGSTKDDLDGTYRLEIKAKVINHVHATDPTASKAVVSYMISAYRLPPGTKPTKRLYLESAGRPTPEGATVITTTGQCKIVLIDPRRPQLIAAEDSTPAQQ